MKAISHNFMEQYEPAGLKKFLALCWLWWKLGGILLLKDGNESLFQIVNSGYSALGDRVFPIITYMGEFAVISLVLCSLFLFKKYRTWPMLILIIGTQLLPFLATQALKFIYASPRPVAVLGNEPWFHKIAGVHLHSSLSFPSGHTAGAFSFFCFMSILLPKKYANWAILFFILAFAVGYSRMYLGQHFFIDVYAGSIVGALLTYFLFHIWKKYFARKYQSNKV